MDKRCVTKLLCDHCYFGKPENEAPSWNQQYCEIGGVPVYPRQPDKLGYFSNFAI